jgi:hypothetical protein
MSEIPTKLEKNRHHLLSKMLWRRKSPSSSNAWLGLGKEIGELIYRRCISTGW